MHNQVIPGLLYMVLQRGLVGLISYARTIDADQNGRCRDQLVAPVCYIAKDPLMLHTTVGRVTYANVCVDQLACMRLWQLGPLVAYVHGSQDLGAGVSVTG